MEKLLIESELGDITLLGSESIGITIEENEKRIQFTVKVSDLTDVLRKRFSNPLSLQRKAELKQSFNSFWERYKKKAAKEDAFKAWCKLTDTERSEVLHRVDKFVRAHSDVKYRPLPATFLRGKRWEDELPEDKKEVKKQWAQANDWGANG